MAQKMSSYDAFEISDWFIPQTDTTSNQRRDGTKIPGLINPGALCFKVVRSTELNEDHFDGAYLIVAQKCLLGIFHQIKSTRVVKGMGIINLILTKKQDHFSQY